MFFHLGGGGGGGKVAWHNFFSSRGWGWWWWWKGWHGTKPFFRFDPFFKIQFKNTSNLILLGFKMSSESFFLQIFQNRSYFLKYVDLRIAKLGPKLSTYRWDTLYNPSSVVYVPEPIRALSDSILHQSHRLTFVMTSSELEIRVVLHLEATINELN